MRRPLIALLSSPCSLRRRPAAARRRRRSSRRRARAAPTTSASEVVKRAVGTGERRDLRVPRRRRSRRHRVRSSSSSIPGARANPMLYGGWIEHLARKGNLVLYPALPGGEPDAAGRRHRDRREPHQGGARGARRRSRGEARPERASPISAISPACRSPSTSRRAPRTDGLPAPKLVFAASCPAASPPDEKERGILLAGSLRPSRPTPAHHHERRPRPPAERPRRAPDPPGGDRRSRRAASCSCARARTTTAFRRSPRPSPRRARRSPITTPPPSSCRPTRRAIRSSATPGAGAPTCRSPASRRSSPSSSATTASTRSITSPSGRPSTWRPRPPSRGKDAAALRRDPRFIDMGTWSDGWPVRRLSADMPKVEGAGRRSRSAARAAASILAPTDTSKQTLVAERGRPGPEGPETVAGDPPCGSIFWPELPITLPPCRRPFPPSWSSIPALAG